MIGENINCRTISDFNKPICLAKARAEGQISFLQVLCQNSKYTNSDTLLTHSDPQNISWLTSNGCIQKVRIGLRKRCLSSFPLFPLLSKIHNFKNLSSNRCFSMPESQILLLQDSCLINVLSLRYSPDVYTPVVPCFRSCSPETQHHRQLASLRC